MSSNRKVGPSFAVTILFAHPEGPELMVTWSIHRFG